MALGQKGLETPVLVEIEASLWQVSLSTQLEEILNLKIFFWMLPRATVVTCGLRVAICPPLVYTIVDLLFEPDQISIVC